MSSQFEELIRLTKEAVNATIEGHPEAVNKWLAGEAGSWGYLAGRGVVTLRNILGRKLEDIERRWLWELLWIRLNQLKNAP